MLAILFQDEQQRQQNTCGLLALWNTAIAVTTTQGQMFQAVQVLDAIGQLLISASGDLEQQPSTIQGQAETGRTLGGGAVTQYVYAVPVAVKKPFAKPIIAASASLKQTKQVLSGSADVLDLELLAFAVGELTAA